jgi:hypothetical protein
LKNDDLLDLIGKVDDKYIAEFYDSEQKDPAPVTPIHAKKPGGWKKWGALAACLAVVIVGGICAFERGSTPAVTPTAAPIVTPAASFPADDLSVVILDVNPSIKINLLSNGDVSSVLSLNSDAAALLDSVDLSGLDEKGCVDAVVRALEDDDYITPAKNSVLVSVIDKDGDEADALRKDIVSDISATQKYSGIEISVVSQVVPDSGKYKNIADKYNISVGKAALIDDIVSEMNDTDYDYSQLAKLSIHALNQTMEYTGSTAAHRTGDVAGAITQKTSEALGIGKMAAADALDLAVSLSDTYDKLCEKCPVIDTSTYTGYDFHLEQGRDKDGSPTWIIVADNMLDGSKSSVEFTLSGDIISDVASAGTAAVSGALNILYNIFGLISDG